MSSIVWISIVISLVLGLFFFYRWNQRPVAWTQDEVVALLESWLNGDLSSEDWDYFISIKIERPDLESLRKEAQEIISETWRNKPLFIK